MAVEGGDRPRELQDYASPKAGADIRAMVERPSTRTQADVERQANLTQNAIQFNEEFRDHDGAPPILSVKTEAGYDQLQLSDNGLYHVMTAHHENLEGLTNRQYASDVVAALRAPAPETQPTTNEDFYGEPQDQLLARLDAQAEKDEHDIDTLYSQIDPLEFPHGDVPHDPAHDL